MKKEIIVLNLCDEILPEMMEYFKEREIKVVDPKVDETPYRWTHILTSNMQDFSFLREVYKTVENNIQIISQSPVHNKQNFIWANGKIILNEFWIKSKVRTFILDKFFQEYLSEDIEFSEVKFKALGKFTLHQFHIVGDYLDQLVATSSEQSVSGVNIRSFLDHTLMYLAGLRNRNKMEFPLEVVYGSSAEAFALQLYFPSQGLMIEDVSSCLGMEGSRHSEETLLTTALNTCDYLDFSLITTAKKMVVTAAWLKGMEVEDASLLLSILPPKAKLVGYLQEGNIENKHAIDDSFASQIQLPEIHDEEVRRISGESFSEIIATRISDVLELERIQRIASSQESEEELVQILKESSQEENDKIVFSSQQEYEDVNNIISSTLSQDNTQLVQKEFIKPEELKKIILNSIREQKPEAIRVKAFEEKISNELSRSLNEFCESKMMKSEDFKREHIKEFETYFLNKGLKEHSIILNPLTKELISDLKTRLSASLVNEFQEPSVENVFEKATHHEHDQMRVRRIFKNNLKESLEATFSFEDRGVIKKEDEEVIATVLGSSPSEREVIKELVQDETAVKPHEPLFQNQISEKEKALMVQLESLKKENQSLLEKLQTTLLEVRVQKDSKNTIAEIKAKVSESSPQTQEEDYFKESIDIRNELKKSLEEDKASTPQKKRMVELLEREVQLMANYNGEMMKAKKIQIEASQKESLYISEMEKLKRQLKARELMLNKSKESMQKIASKKDAEIESLNAKLNKSNTLLAKEDNRTALENKHLRAQNINLAKQLDVYKVKLSSLSENLKNKEKSDNSKEAIRKLQMEKNQMKNMFDQAQKEFARVELRAKVESERAQELASEVAQLKEELNNLSIETKAAQIKEKSPEPVQEIDNVMSETQSTQLRELESKIVQLEAKLAEANKNQKGSFADEKKIIHLENSVKKLTQDIAEARNSNNDLKKEANKLRQEKTALQNQIERMKKEALKNKKAA